jgi:hypothetical protein
MEMVVRIAASAVAAAVVVIRKNVRCFNNVRAFPLLSEHFKIFIYRSAR